MLQQGFCTLLTYLPLLLCHPHELLASATPIYLQQQLLCRLPGFTHTLASLHSVLPDQRISSFKIHLRTRFLRPLQTTRTSSFIPVKIMDITTISGTNLNEASGLIKYCNTLHWALSH